MFGFPNKIRLLTQMSAVTPPMREGCDMNLNDNRAALAEGSQAFNQLLAEHRLAHSRYALNKQVAAFDNMCFRFRFGAHSPHKWFQL